MAEICLKTRTHTYCSASPIRDCGCHSDPAFTDPFPRLATTLDQTGLLQDIGAVLHTAGSGVPIGKLRIIAQIARLVLLEKVSVDECFVITALDCHPSGPGGTETGK